MQFPVKGKEKEYLLIFTTTPWTVPGNVALAVNKKILYVLAEINDSRYWIAEKRLEELEQKYKIIEKKKGKDLEGMEYIMPYASLDVQKDSPHNVVLWDLANEEEGTGIVHIAPGSGAEDHQLGKKIGLPSIEVLDGAGIYIKGLGSFSGKRYSVVNDEVIKDLQQKGFMYKVAPYPHRYPHCWRCSSELVFRLVDEWYIKCTDEFRNKLIRENDTINWYPKYGKARQKHWFENMGDWLISRKRYYGLPLPIWECLCGNVEVIGSLEELKKKAIKQDVSKIDKLPSIHKPWIDDIKIVCPKCSKEVKRIPEVGDAWLDAGIVAFSTMGPHLQNKEEWKKWYPADFITEGYIDQFRGWFNALFWASVALTGKVCFKNLFGYERLLAEDGKEMHKSWGNAVAFDEAAKKVGADPMRLLYTQNDPSQDIRFGYNVLKDPSRDLLVLLNISKLIKQTKKVQVKNIEGIWILSKMNSLIETVTKELDLLHPHLAIRALKDFWLNDLSRGYIQFVRDKINQDDKETIYVLTEVYMTLLKLCAPFIPFITEQIWQILKQKSIVKEESVHLSGWPKTDKTRRKVALEIKMVIVTKIIEIGLAERSKEKMGLRWPLAKATILGGDYKFDKDLISILKSQLNVKNIEFRESHADAKSIAVDLDMTITPELEAEGYARELSRFIQNHRRKMGLKKEDLVKTYILVDDKFKHILDERKDFIKERTNSKKLEIVTTGKERFKNKVEFSIKNKKGEVEVVL